MEESNSINSNGSNSENNISGRTNSSSSINQTNYKTISPTFLSESLNDDDVFIDKISSSNLNFHKLFDLPEETVIEKFICALLLGKIITQGNLFITHNYVCFYSKLFVKVGKKTKIQIKISDILLIRKKRVFKSIPNGIEIITPDKKYTWTSFLHRDNAYDLMDSLWRQVKPNPNESFHQLPISPNLSEELKFDEEEDDRNMNFDIPLPLVPCTHQMTFPVNTQPRYSKVFPTNAQNFYQTFFTNESLPYWKEFHALNGYLNFEMSDWIPSEQSCCMQRRAKFKTPIGFSKYTRVTQHHRLTFLNSGKFVFEISSFSKDVPYSNQFLVDAKWVVSNIDQGRCELIIYIVVRFLKKNWLKSLIEHSAFEGVSHWYECWLKSTYRLSFSQNNQSGAELTNHEAASNLSKVDEKEEREKKEIVNPLIKYSLKIQRTEETLFLKLFIGFGVLLILLFFILIYSYFQYISLKISLESELENFEVNEIALQKLTSLDIDSRQKVQLWASVFGDLVKLDNLVNTLSQVTQQISHKATLFH